MPNTGVNGAVNGNGATQSSGGSAAPATPLPQTAPERPRTANSGGRSRKGSAEGIQMSKESAGQKPSQKSKEKVS